MGKLFPATCDYPQISSLCSPQLIHTVDKLHLITTKGYSSLLPSQ